MAHDVFISYSSKDKAVADAACATLEARKVRCWIAPRDVLPGSEYGAALLDAIEGARVMVLILSTHSNTSPQVMREVERSVSKGIPILPFRIEDVTLSRSMEYFVSSQHWLDAITPPLERHLSTLCDSVAALLGTSIVAEQDRNENPELATTQYRLRITAGSMQGRIVELNRTRITVGRSQVNDLPVPERSFSRSHFALNWDDARKAWTLVDFGSANGVRVNGERVVNQRELRVGDVIRVDPVEMVFEAIPSAPAVALSRLTLSISSGGASETRTFDSDSGRVLVGRAAGCDLRLDDRIASSRHVMFVRESNGDWTVLDAGSANGTWLNGEKLVRAVAKPGDVVLVGSTQIRVEAVE